MDESKQPDPVDIVVGSRVRAARMALNMSQGALADQLGVSFQQVQKYENGSNRISASRLVQIANTLRVSPLSFLAGLGDFEPGPGASAPSSPQMRELTDLVGQLPAPMQDAVLQLARSLAEGGTEPRRRRAGGR